MSATMPAALHAGDSTSYRRFKMGACRPGEAAATVSNPDDIQAGRIEVLLVQVQDTGARTQQAPAPAAAGPSSDAASKKLPEGKKVSSVCRPGMQWCQAVHNHAHACMLHMQDCGTARSLLGLLPQGK